MLVMKNINKIFQTADIQTHALRDFCLQVNEGDFVSVTGPSGSGKTTFLNIAGLLETYSNGEFFVLLLCFHCANEAALILYFVLVNYSLSKTCSAALKVSVPEIIIWSPAFSPCNISIWLKLRAPVVIAVFSAKPFSTL